MSFINNDRVVLFEEPIRARLCEQYAVGHQLDQRVGLRRIGEADFEADRASQRRLQFLCHASRDRTCGDSTRLRVADRTDDPTAHGQTELRQLRRFPRTCFTANDDNLMFPQRRFDLAALRENRQIVVERNRRHAPLPLITAFDRAAALFCKLRCQLFNRLLSFLRFTQLTQHSPQPLSITEHGLRDATFPICLRHNSKDSEKLFNPNGVAVKHLRLIHNHGASRDNAHTIASNIALNRFLFHLVSFRQGPELFAT